VPTYEFRCGACGHVFEVKCKFGEHSSCVECPVCGGRGDMVFGVPVVVYKGKGFYTTDKGP
jgi:putative FmdB family regulatory protein